MKLFVVSLVGIPASGKSTLARRILKMSSENSLSVNVVVVSFDDMMKIDFKSISDGDYKQHREEFFNKLERILTKFKDDLEILSNEIPSDSFHVTPENTSTLFILDDNMYLRSMRQRSRKMCKNCRCDHFQIYIKCFLDVALVRNSQRINSVDKLVIEKMFNDLEVPLNSRTITIEAPIADDDLLNDLNDRMSMPETLTEEPQKIAQDQSIIHEMDLITRKELSLRIQELKSTDNLNRISLKFNAMRKQFMDDVRNERLEFSSIEELKIAFRNLLDDE